METPIVVLSLIGLADALYTAIQQRFPQLFSFCFTTSLQRTDCEEILHGRYARVFGVPNSWLGALAYAGLAWIYATGTPLLIGALIASAGLAFSYYLLYVQAFVLRKYCIFCLLSTTLLTIITALAWTV